MMSLSTLAARSCLQILAAAAVVAAAATAPVAAQSAAPVELPAAGGEIRAGDVIKLVVWREDDLTGEFPVHENGIAVFPKVGEYRVAGETRESLREKLVRDFSTYLRNPSIDVIVLRRVKVLGAVLQPGLYPVDPTMTVGDVLALAGGPSNTGRKDRLALIRDGERVETVLDEAMRVADAPIQSGDVLYVPEKSWLARNIGFVLSTTAAVAVAVLLR